MSSYRPFARRFPGFSLRAPLALYAVVALALPVMCASQAQAKAYKGAEVYSSITVLYGRMEMRMRMIRGSGLLSTFFTYKNGSELSGAQWGELDVEALGKNDAKAWQSNLITGNPRVTSEEVYTSPTSLADDYHTYQIEWTPEYVSWSFDGTEVRRTQGGQASELRDPHSLRFNVWSSEGTGWAGELDESALPAYQFVNWIRYYRYENGEFLLDWTDDFDSFDESRWSKGTWTFDGNRVDFDPANAVVEVGTLILAITKEGSTGFSGTVPMDPQGNASTAPVAPSTPTSPGTPSTPAGSDSESGCSLAPSRPSHEGGVCLAALCLLVFASVRLAARRRR
ncbi:MAG: family 16 glycosylhydrolase [Deltaproteobacteria bacterium]|nr:family 16 glycosylhydrolase [Deltaproteobacteria bacterium]